VAGSCEHGDEPSGPVKGGGISWLAEWLWGSQEDSSTWSFFFTGHLQNHMNPLFEKSEDWVIAITRGKGFVSHISLCDYCAWAAFRTTPWHYKACEQRRKANIIIFPCYRKRFVFRITWCVPTVLPGFKLDVCLNYRRGWCTYMVNMGGWPAWRILRTVELLRRGRQLKCGKSKVKLSRYTPWRHMGGEEV
jgi:hypothetical protein